MVFRIELPQNTEAEERAFIDTCDRLAGFNEALDAESIEGFLTSLVAARELPPTETWLAAMCGETFGRVFADPEGHAAALQSLQSRLRVLRAQLDLEALFDDADNLRLEPWVPEWTDADRRRLVVEEGWGEADVALLRTGVLWADGFLAGVRALPDVWAVPADEEATERFDQAFAQIGVLTMDPEGEPFRSYVERVYAGGPIPDREGLFVEACLSVQDLRMYWVDYAPRVATRRVEPTPGRNDPCPCGSGKKYKKCHGAD